MKSIYKLKEESLSDIAIEDKANFSSKLNRVGMSNVEMLVITKRDKQTNFAQPAKVDLFVSLDDPDAKGIHMSRLYVSAKEIFETKVLDLSLLKELSKSMLESHHGLSESAFIKVAFDLMLERPALISDKTGYRSYPIEIIFELNKNGKEKLCVNLELVYSSTCPCSAALSRQLIQEAFAKKFATQTSNENSLQNINFEEVFQWLGQEESQAAVPHGQRSQAKFNLELDTSSEIPSTTFLIDAFEAAITTPVQTAVKREDEQEFARLNAVNKMFCEDAARRLKKALEANASIKDYKVEVRHQESLHPHDAVAIAAKGIVGGFQA